MLIFGGVQCLMDDVGESENRGRGLEHSRLSTRARFRGHKRGPVVFDADTEYLRNSKITSSCRYHFRAPFDGESVQNVPSPRPPVLFHVQSQPSSLTRASTSNCSCRNLALSSNIGSLFPNFIFCVCSALLESARGRLKNSLPALLRPRSSSAKILICCTLCQLSASSQTKECSQTTVYSPVARLKADDVPDVDVLHPPAIFANHIRNGEPAVLLPSWRW